MKYFKLDEFACSCGCGRHEGKMDDQFLFMLDDARGLCGIPFKITSGYRCPAYNKTVGGKKNSAHLKGLAADLSVPNDEARILMVQALLDAGFERFGIGKNFIHADNSQTLASPRMWVYGS